MVTPLATREGHLGCVRIEVSYRSLNGFLGPKKAPRWIMECLCRIGQLFYDHLVFFPTASKFFSPGRDILPRESKKNGIPAAKHIYTSVRAPLWSQNSRKCPQNPALEPYMQKGPSVHPPYGVICVLASLVFSECGQLLFLVLVDVISLSA
jgi:hypothetical protein